MLWLLYNTRKLQWAQYFKLEIPNVQFGTIFANPFAYFENLKWLYS